MAASALIGAWLAGALGGLHCVAMCGGFVAAFSGAGGAARAPDAPLLPARTLARRNLGYNLGRITTYALLGAAVGGVGAAALSAVDWLPVQRALYVLANLFLLALALAMVTRKDGFASLQRAGSALFARVLPAVRPLMLRESDGARYALGMIWGLVPCALIYSVLPVALFAGGAAEGAAVMLAFGIGTLPNLVAAGWIVARARAWLGSRGLRYGAALLLAGFAAVGIWRALFGPLSLSHGPFCL